MRCVVTGGSGFIGSHVVSALTEAGHDATVVDTRMPQTEAVRFAKVDIQEVDRLTEVMAAHGQDAAFHLAAVANARESLADPVCTVEVNIRGTACVLEAARRAGVRRVILASTVWVFNAVDQSVSEEDVRQGRVRYLTEGDPLLPQGGGHIYTTSKIASEMLCHDFHRLFGLDFTILRYGIPYGPRMWPGLALRAFVENSFNGKPLRIFGDGSAVRRFLYVGDLARAHVLVLADVAKGQTYSIEGDRDVTIRELAETVAEFVPNVKIEYVVDPARRGELSLSGVAISNTKAKTELGWRPTVELREGVQNVIDWYRKHHLEG